MYVDDTDLLLWPGSFIAEVEELIAYIQCVTTDWGSLAQASGGLLKDNKCSLYLLFYNFIRGRARMKQLQDLPEPQRYIPLPNPCKSIIELA